MGALALNVLHLVYSMTGFIVGIPIQNDKCGAPCFKGEIKNPKPN